MNRNKLFLDCCMLTAGLLASCSNDNEGTGNDGSKEIVLRSSVANLQTRSPHTDIISGQKVGVYVTGSTFGDVYNHEEYVSAGNGVLNTSNSCEYPSSGTVDIVAYHPMQASTPTTTGFDFTVNTDQSTDAAYCSSDLLHASATGLSASSSAVTMNFSHKLSNVSYALNQTISNAVVTIYGVETAASFHIENGTVGTAVTSATGNVVLHNTYGAVVAPQTITAGSVYFTMNDGTSAYTSNTIAANTFLSGKIYRYNLNLSNGVLTVGSCTISDWGYDSNSDLSGSLESLSPTVTSYPSFTEVENTTTFIGTNLANVSAATVNGYSATISSQTDTSITIAMPADISTTTENVVIVLDGTTVVNDFKIVNSLLKDGNFENANLTYTGNNLSTTLQQWLYYNHTTNFPNVSATINTESNNSFLSLSNNNVATGWYNFYAIQYFNITSGYTKAKLSFRAKASADITNATVRIYLSEGLATKFFLSENNTGYAGYPITTFGTDYQTYSTVFDLLEYIANVNSITASNPTSTQSQPDDTQTYNVRFTINGASALTYYFDDVTLELTN